MAQKKIKVDWNKYLDTVEWNQDMADFINSLSEASGRDLYEMESRALTARYLIDRPVNYALYSTTINYPVDPIEIMKYSLIDGVAFVRVEGKDNIKIDEFVSIGNFNPISDELEFVERKWLFEDEYGNDLWHIEWYTLNPDGTALFVQYEAEDDTKPELWVVIEEMGLPFLPYVGIPWISSQSFLVPYRDAIIRLEGAFRVIGVENIERMGLSLYLEGVRDVDQIKTAPRKMGRRVHMLPKDSKFHSPAPDQPGMQLMIEEIDLLEKAIQRASGVISPRELANMSAEAKKVAEKPLLILAEDVRKRFMKGMQSIVEKVQTIESAPALRVSFKPLREVADKSGYLAVLEVAREANAIDDKEYINELRCLLDMPERE